MKISLINTTDLSNLEKLLAMDAEFVLQVPCPMVGFAQSYYDLAQDFLAALFVGENIAPFCSAIECEERRENSNLLIVFRMKPNDPKMLAERLSWLASGFDDSKSYGEGHDDFDNFHDALAEFSFDLEQKATHFPMLADSYKLHWVLWLPEEYDISELRRWDRGEYRYGYYKSFLSTSLGYELFVSTEGWIAPGHADISKALKDYGGFLGDPPSLEIAMYIASNAVPPILISRGNVIHFPQVQYETAKRCAEDVWAEGVQRPEPGLKGLPQCLLSINADVAVIRDSTAQYIFFRDALTAPNEAEVRQYIQLMQNAEEGLREVIGEPTDLRLPWDQISDDQFEELCYYIIEKHYTLQSIRKMGNSRSRDGGRDIVFETAPRLGASSVTWIAQCKLLKDGGSLAGTKVDIADPVLQYGAGGYCVMTSGIIDSTLYDKLDGIAQHRQAEGRKLERSTWSRLEIERFLARNRDIRERFFKAKN